MKRKKIVACVLFVIFMLGVSIYTQCCNVLQFENGFLVNYEDIASVNKNKTFGFFIRTQLQENERIVGGEKTKQTEVIFKLFGVIPVKKVEAVLASDEEYYVGGVPIGISICSDGLIVVGNEDDNSEIFKEGDIITEINNQQIKTTEDLQNILEKANDEVEVKFIRKNKELKTITKILKDKDSGKLKLGLWVKDDISGVGTLTFVNKNTYEYSALGHPIIEGSGGNIVPVASGDIYKCNLIGINKGKRNNPGELRCVFMSNDKSKGDIKSNSKFGINGVLKDVRGFVDENLTAKLGGRLGVKVGKAKIVSSVSGIREEYDIEIIKANYQKTAKDKSLIFRVKDKRLLNLTGGIVQGMSGSPIIQDGKIIGAVTHVFLTDPTKGYGVYSDFMLT